MEIGKGYIHVYTGDGKGKTTAALGLALRAAGWGLKTYVGQFMKGQAYGELKACQLLSPFLEIVQFGKETFIHVKEGPSEEDVRLAKEGLEKVRAAMKGGEYSIVVADEILVAVFFELLDEEDVLSLMEEKPAGVELVLTGRKATARVIRRADLVTEMKEIKHYYQEGVPGREGIER